MASHRSAQTRTEAGVENRLMPGGRWRVVRERSRIGFRVKKTGLYYVKESFKHVEGEIEETPDGSIERGDLTVQARTISTRMPPRDWHLRSKDFRSTSRTTRRSGLPPKASTRGRMRSYA